MFAVKRFTKVLSSYLIYEQFNFFMNTVYSNFVHLWYKVLMIKKIIKKNNYLNAFVISQTKMNRYWILILVAKNVKRSKFF